MCPILVSSVLASISSGQSTNCLQVFIGFISSFGVSYGVQEVTKNNFLWEVLYSLVFPDFLMSNGFWAVTDGKITQSGSKIQIFELILYINGSPFLKVFFLLRKQGKPTILPYL